jgi:hypothetical protein
VPTSSPKSSSGCRREASSSETPAAPAADALVKSISDLTGAVTGMRDDLKKDRERVDGIEKNVELMGAAFAKTIALMAGVDVDDDADLDEVLKALEKKPAAPKAKAPRDLEAQGLGRRGRRRRRRGRREADRQPARHRSQTHRGVLTPTLTRARSARTSCPHNKEIPTHAYHPDRFPSGKRRRKQPC